MSELASDKRPPTEAEVKLFFDEVRYWIDKFGLHDWEVFLSVEDFQDNSFAKCSINHVARTASIMLCGLRHHNYWSEVRIRRAALHEVIELLTVPFWPDVADDDKVSAEKTGDSHGIIHRLSHVLLGLRDGRA